jgi:hypothetical protein
LKKGTGENASDEAVAPDDAPPMDDGEGKDSSSSLSKDAKVDSDLYKSTNSLNREPESGDSLSKDA